MSNNIQSYDDLWDLEKPIISKCSRLHHLNPIGVGTPLVESLTSYIARLADCHSVLSGVLISREIAPLTEQIFVKEVTSRGLHALFDRATALNGTGKLAKDFVEALEKLTLRKELKSLTLTFWADIIPSRGLFRSHKAWCPFCYHQNKLSGQTVYDPLLWTINAVKTCPQHHQTLCDRCHKCQQQIPWLTWQARPGYCSNCGHWLGLDLKDNQYIKPVEPETILKDNWIVEAIGEMITATTYLSSPLPKENIAKSFNIVIDLLTEGNLAAFARLIGMPKNTVWMWSTGKAIPQLSIISEICYLLKMSLLSFLQLRETGGESLTMILDKTQEQSHKRRISPRTFDSKQVHSALLAALQTSDNPPPTMKSVARELGYDLRTITRHFPDLCHSIAAKRLDYRKSLHIKNIEQSCQEVEQIALQLCYKGIYPSEARVSEQMSNPGSFRYKKLRVVLEKIQQQFSTISLPPHF